jgi:hypothetical protein
LHERNTWMAVTSTAMTWRGPDDRWKSLGLPREKPEPDSRGLVPAIHVFLGALNRRECPAQGRA